MTFCIKKVETTNFKIEITKWEHMDMDVVG